MGFNSETNRQNNSNSCGERNDFPPIDWRKAETIDFFSLEEEVCRVESNAFMGSRTEASNEVDEDECKRIVLIFSCGLEKSTSAKNSSTIIESSEGEMLLVPTEDDDDNDAEVADFVEVMTAGDCMKLKPLVALCEMESIREEDSWKLSYLLR